MKPPSTIAAQVSRDRAAAGRLFHVRAAVSTPGAQRVAPARQALEDFHARATLREARRRAGAEAARKFLAAERRKVGPRVAAALAAKAVPKATLDKMREDMARAAGEDDFATKEEFVRKYKLRHRVTLAEALAAFERHVRPGGAR